MILRYIADVQDFRHASSALRIDPLEGFLYIVCHSGTPQQQTMAGEEMLYCLAIAICDNLAFPNNGQGGDAS